MARGKNSTASSGSSTRSERGLTPDELGQVIDEYPGDLPER
jgi:hypothetical protein